MNVPLREIAHARSGDKGNGANIGVIAYTSAGYAWLVQHLTREVVETRFRPMGVGRVERFEMPNIGALNFVLPNVLAGGGSRSLRIDAQGKALGQALLEMRVEVPDDVLAAARRNAPGAA
jgi:hypothetical protein